jgi:hypothetical protein
MNWEAISTIAEIVSATAVVVSLIYLAAQIRQNKLRFAKTIGKSTSKFALCDYKRTIPRGLISPH